MIKYTVDELWNSVGSMGTPFKIKQESDKRVLHIHGKRNGGYEFTFEDGGPAQFLHAEWAQKKIWSLEGIDPDNKLEQEVKPKQKEEPYP